MFVVSFVPVRRPDGIAPYLRRRRTLRTDWAQRTACSCRRCVQASCFPARMHASTNSFFLSVNELVVLLSDNVKTQAFNVESAVDGRCCRISVTLGQTRKINL